MVVGLGILLVHEVNIIRTNQLDAILTGQLNEHLVGLLLQWEGLAISTLRGVFHFVALKLQIIVVAKEVMLPLKCLTSTSHVASQNLMRYLAGNTCRTNNEAFVVAFQLGTVGTGTHVVAIHPRV